MLKLIETIDITTETLFSEPKPRSRLGVGFKRRYQVNTYEYNTITLIEAVEAYDVFQGLGTMCWMRD